MAEESQVSMKLLIDKKNHKVLFAEASKEVVDFLFNILSLPVGTIVRLLTKQGMVGCLSNLYESIETLSNDYIQPNQNKNTLLNPNPPTQVPLLSLNAVPTTVMKYYNCNSTINNSGVCYECGDSINSSHLYVTDSFGTPCPHCGHKMKTEITYVGGAALPNVGSVAGEGGFVKGVVTYMVMDDLVVQPMSTISSITLLNKFNVKEVASLEEKVVNLDMDKGLKLLKASLQTNMVLTNVFLDSMVA